MGGAGIPRIRRREDEDRQAAARLLGLKRTTLVAKIRKYSFDGKDEPTGCASAAAGGLARA